MRNCNQILHGELTKVNVTKIFERSSKPPALAIIFVTPMVSSDMFVVANLLVPKSQY